jgi:hypothetical protein
MPLESSDWLKPAAMQPPSHWCVRSGLRVHLRSATGQHQLGAVSGFHFGLHGIWWDSSVLCTNRHCARNDIGPTGLARLPSSGNVVVASLRPMSYM